MCKLIIEYQKTKRDETYTKIFNKYYNGLKSYLSKYSHNSQIVDDAALMAFEQARINIDSFNSDLANFKTWFYTIAGRIMIRMLEKEKIYYNTCFENGDTEDEKIQTVNIAKKLLEQSNPHEDEHNPLLSKIRVPDRNTDDPLLCAYDSVLNEIGNLKGDLKDVVIDSYLNNMTFERIMNKYNLSESQVKLKLLTGRKEIRKVFHNKKVDDLKESLDLDELNISDELNNIIQKRLKYNGELIVIKKGRGYSYKYTISNNKVNMTAITNHVEQHNNKINKEISNYTEVLKMDENPSYAKRFFNKQIKTLKDEGYDIEKEEIKKAEDFNYVVSVKGIVTRNRTGNKKSNLKLMKVEKIERIKPGKLQLLEKRANAGYDIDDKDYATKMLPYINTDLLMEEISNLKIKQLSSGKYSSEKTISRIDKDRFSALAYGLWYIKTFEDNIYQETEIDAMKYLFIN